MGRDLIFGRSLVFAGLLVVALPAILTAQARPGGSGRIRPSPKAARSPSPTPEPTPPPGWQNQPDPRGYVRLVRPSQEIETSTGASWRFDRKNPPRSSLAVSCKDAKLEMALHPATEKAFLTPAQQQEPVLMRLDKDKAFEQHVGWGGFTFSDGVGLVKKLLAHDWLVLRYVGYNGYREHTFDLEGLDKALTPLEPVCGLPAGTVAAAAAVRPAGKRPPPPAVAEDELKVGAWTVFSRLNRFDDSRTVVAAVDSTKPLLQEKPEPAKPARLIVRALGGSIETYVTFPMTVLALKGVRFDDAPARPYRGDSATGDSGLFISPTPRLLRQMAAHRRMEVTAIVSGQRPDVVAEFDLAGFEKAAPAVLEAAGLTSTVLSEVPRTGKWQAADEGLSRALLRLPEEGAAATGAALLIECKKSRDSAYLVAPGLTDKNTKNMLIGFDGETPQKKTMYPSTGDAELAPAATVLALSNVGIGREDLLRHRRLRVRFNKTASEVVFDLSGLDTWLEPLEEAGCKIK